MTKKKIKLFKNVNICSNFCAFKYDYIRVTSNKKRRKHTGINEISFINYWHAIKSYMIAFVFWGYLILLCNRWIKCSNENKVSISNIIKRGM